VRGPAPEDRAHGEPAPNGADTAAAATVGAAAFALCDTLHELAHVAPTALPTGVDVLSVASVGVGTSSASPVVAIAGPLANLVLAGALVAARRTRWPANRRCFAWLFATTNAFNAAAYLLYSALLASGDWATVLDALAGRALWRPAAGLAGLALYAAAVVASLAVLRALVADAVLSPPQARRYCLAAYGAGGLLLTIAAALNPFDPWLILMSGVATGFGAMVGFVFLPALLERTPEGMAPTIGRARFDRGWVAASGLAALAFVVVLGPGIRLGAG